LVNFGVNRRYGAVLCRLAGVIIFNSCAICSSWRSRMVKKLKLLEGAQLSHPGVAGPRVVRYVFWGDRRRSLRWRSKGVAWARMLAYITGTVDQELLLRNEYLVAENRILKAQLKGA
jgi:hypothetical protein